jgi:glycosyltransferase involved in cell wall biosynthesis
LALLKSWDFGRWVRDHGPGAGLPYRIDHLQEHRIRLEWTDSVHSDCWAESKLGSAVRRSEARLVPYAQTLVMGRRIASSPATLAMFESEANFLAALRRALPGRRSSVLAVITCWLAELVTQGDKGHRSFYRQAYRAVDRVYCFSASQAPLLQEGLGVPPGRVRVIPFGVDADRLRPAGAEDGGYVLVVGRDRGRDWKTTFDALGGLDTPVKVCARSSDVAGLRIPAGVEFLGYVTRDRYEDLLRHASVVVVATRQVAYPSGQSVMLEAMAAGRAVVVTRTDPLREYFDDGRTALGVEVGEADGLRAAVSRATGDADLRRRLGAAARSAVEERFNARVMWSLVAKDLHELVADRRRG